MRHSRETDFSIEAMQALAEEAVRAFPRRFREHLGDVIVRVREFADEEQLASVDIQNKWDLSGLYEGRPLSEKSVWDSSEMPPMISLFRQPLLLECRETGVEMRDLVTHVVVHEAGHHFGFSDDDMHILEDETD